MTCCNIRPLALRLGTVSVAIAGVLANTAVNASAVVSIGVSGLLARYRTVSNVAPVVDILPVNLVSRLVRGCGGIGDGLAQSDGAKHAPTARYDFVVRKRGARMKYFLISAIDRLGR